jgi:hypothetical protein
MEQSNNAGISIAENNGLGDEKVRDENEEQSLLAGQFSIRDGNLIVSVDEVNRNENERSRHPKRRNNQNSDHNNHRNSQNNNRRWIPKDNNDYPSNQNRRSKDPHVRVQNSRNRRRETRNPSTAIVTSSITGYGTSRAFGPMRAIYSTPYQTYGGGKWACLPILKPLVIKRDYPEWLRSLAFIDVLLTVPEFNQLQEDYNSTTFVYKKLARNSSGHRLIRSYREVAKQALYHDYSGKHEDIKIISLFDAGIKHLIYGHVLHAVSPTITTKDGARHSGRLWNDEVTVCKHTIEEVGLKPMCECSADLERRTNIIIIHGLYYLTQRNIAQLLTRGYHEISAVIHRFPSDQSKGTIGEARWIRCDAHKNPDSRGNHIRMVASGDDAEYFHSDMSWLTTGGNQFEVDLGSEVVIVGYVMSRETTFDVVYRFERIYNDRIIESMNIEGFDEDFEFEEESDPIDIIVELIANECNSLTWNTRTAKKILRKIDVAATAAGMKITPEQQLEIYSKVVQEKVQWEHNLDNAMYYLYAELPLLNLVRNGEGLSEAQRNVFVTRRIMENLGLNNMFLPLISTFVDYRYKIIAYSSALWIGFSALKLRLWQSAKQPWTEFPLFGNLFKILKKPKVMPAIGISIAFGVCGYYLYNKDKVKHVYTKYQPNIQKVLKGECQRHKPKNEFIVETTDEFMIIPNDYYLDDCDEKNMFYSYGTVLKYKPELLKAVAHCVHNEVHSVASRVMNNVIENTDPKFIATPDDDIIEEYSNFVQDNFERLFHPPDVPPRIAWKEWLLQCSPPKREALLQGDDENWDEVKINRIFEKYGRSEPFLKTELIITDKDNKPARVIMGPTANIKALAGPACARLGKAIKATFSIDSHCPLLHYASGQDKLELGAWYSKAMEDIVGELTCIEIDFARFDLHHSEPQFEVQYNVMDILIGTDPIMERWKVDQMVKRGTFKHGTKFTRRGIRGSGGMETTQGNTILNGMANLWAWYLILREEKIINDPTEMIDQPIRIILLGDDSYTITTPEFGDLAERYLVRHFSNIGWSIKFKRDLLPIGTFCSSVFIPCLTAGKRTYVLCNKPGRLLLKFAYSNKKYGKQWKQMAYLRGILLGMPEIDCIPFMAAWRKRLLEIISTSKQVKNNKVYFDVVVSNVLKHSKRFEAFGRIRTKVTCIEATFEFLQTRYDTSRAMIDDLEVYMRNIPSLNSVLDHPLLEIMVDMDC